MDPATLVESLCQGNDTKIVLVSADGLGGIAGARTGTELEVANTPHLDRLALQGTTGLLDPIGPAISCGSGPGHLALFGYDPLAHPIGRGVLEALGIGFELGPDDVAARGNFCTLSDAGEVRDRRAGRLSSERASVLAEKLDSIEIPGVEVVVRPIREHRFLLVLRGDGLGPKVTGTDPEAVGRPPRRPRAEDEEASRTAEVVSRFVERAREVLADDHPANMVLLRGFDRLPSLPSMQDRYGMRPCALAAYPMYRGLARLLGMNALECGPELDDQIAALKAAWADHDFFFLHYKDTDTAGEDGDFDGKVRAIEALDQRMPRVLELGPDVLIVTSDHSTPSQLATHSWHPVPALLAAATCRRDDVESFGETACAKGGLGRLPTRYLMALALAHAGRLRRFGA